MDSNPHNPDKELLIVGSSRVHGLEWGKRPGFVVRVLSYGGLTYQDLISKVDSSINSNTVALILVGLQVELHSRTVDRQGRAGLVYANPTPPISEIVTSLSSSDYGWKLNGGNTLV